MVRKLKKRGENEEMRCEDSNQKIYQKCVIFWGWEKKFEFFDFLGALTIFGEKENY